MTSAARKTQTDPQPSGRFLTPDTPPADRIDQLVLVEPGQQHLLPHRIGHAEWLKKVLALRWNPDLPQPFIGYDADEGTFVVEWQSEAECNTLTIDAENRRGWYEPWPAPKHADLPEGLDLDTEEAWHLLGQRPHDHRTITSGGPYYRQVHPNNFQDGRVLSPAFVLQDTGCHLALSLNDGSRTTAARCHREYTQQSGHQSAAVLEVSADELAASGSHRVVDSSK